MAAEKVLTVLTEEQIAQCEKCERRIITETGKIEKGFIKIAPDLYRIKAVDGYRIKNYKNMEKYAKEVLGMGRSTMYNLFGIVERFGDPKTYEIRDKYRNLTMRQLVKLMPLPEKDEGNLPDGWQSLSSAELGTTVKSLTSLEGEAEAAKEKKVQSPSKVFVSEREFTRADINQFNGKVLERLLNEAEDEMKKIGLEPDKGTTMILRVVLVRGNKEETAEV